MRLNRRIQIQLAVFVAVTLIAGAVIVFGYARVPALLGIGHYTVTVQLPQAGGLYAGGNVTYRGTEVGRVKDVRLTDSGVAAVLSLRSDIPIPSDLDAQVHSQSAAGEQYVALLPRTASSAPLKNGDIVGSNRASVPPDINNLLDASNKGLQAIPHDNLKTVIDESYTAIGGLGREISRLVKGSTQLAIDARKDLNSLTALIEQSPAVLDSQADTSDAIQAWAAHVAVITEQLRMRDDSLAGLIQNGGPALDEGRQLFERLQPTLPILLANLVSIGKVAVAYQPNIEQALVLLPQGTAMVQGIGVANMNTNQDYKGTYLDFNLNFNLPPVCATGFLPPQQQRAPTFEDYPDRPAGDLYCRVPQDSPFNARGARNYPCATVPGKRAPTVKMCESDEEFVPLNDGYNWKGDPNATLSGQDVPQQAAPSAAPTPRPPPVAVIEYDPATGTYLAPDGRVYTQADLANPAPQQTWQSMLLPPTGN
jgi:phospholipid/cholesterol/gamma-HCH transport system substrate-binding protein